MGLFCSDIANESSYVCEDGQGNIVMYNLLSHTSNQLALFSGVLKQKRKDTNKVYSLHEPGVECISKGKEHKKYEFGSISNQLLVIKE